MTEQDTLTWTPEAFKAWRAWMGWTQEQAAEALDVNRSSVIDWESGKYAIDRRTVLSCTAYRVARYLAGEGQRFAAADPSLQGEHRDLTAKIAAIDATRGAGRGRPPKSA